MVPRRRRRRILRAQLELDVSSRRLTGSGTKKEEEEENKVLRVQYELGRVNSWRADSEKGNQIIRALLEFGLVKQDAKGGGP